MHFHNTSILLQVPPAITMSEASSFQTNTVEWFGTKFCQLRDRGVAIWGRNVKKGKLKRLLHVKGAKPGLHVYYQHGQGEQLTTWPQPNCKHIEEGECGLLEVFIDSKQYLAVSCPYCETITLHSFPNGNVEAIFNVEDAQPKIMCHGPDDTILVSGYTNSTVIQVSCSANDMEITEDIPIEIETPRAFCCREQQIFCGDWLNKVIISTDIVSKETLWVIRDEIDGEMIRPHGMCTDKLERLYVADGENCRILVLHTKSGDFIQSIELPELGCLVDIGWNDTQPHLTICCQPMESDNYEIAHYNID